MGAKTTISWTDATWSAIRARVKPDAAQIATAKGYTSLLRIIHPGRVGPHCEHVSPGCENCYSETNNGRCLTFNGTGLPFDRRARDLVDIFVDEKILKQPLRWRKPKRIFVCSQTDLFGEFVTDEQIDRVFAVMALCQQHTFQVLTKRPERMRSYIGRSKVERPLPNVWAGVSVENQEVANKRIPLLLHTPAAVRYVSYEPALGRVDFTRVDYRSLLRETLVAFARWSAKEDGKDPEAAAEHAARSIPDGELPPDSVPVLNALTGEWFDGWDSGDDGKKLDWVIVGGESGHGARPFSLRWARNIVRQCATTSVPCFIKQLGSRSGNPSCADPECTHPDCDAGWLRLKDKKGGDIEEFPDDLKIREFPEVQV